MNMSDVIDSAIESSPEAALGNPSPRQRSYAVTRREGKSSVKLRSRIETGTSDDLGVSESLQSIPDDYGVVDDEGSTTPAPRSPAQDNDCAFEDDVSPNGPRSKLRQSEASEQAARWEKATVQLESACLAQLNGKGRERSRTITKRQSVRTDHLRNLVCASSIDNSSSDHAIVMDNEDSTEGLSTASTGPGTPVIRERTNTLLRKEGRLTGRIRQTISSAGLTETATLETRGHRSFSERLIPSHLLTSNSVRDVDSVGSFTMSAVSSKRNSLSSEVAEGDHTLDGTMDGGRSPVAGRSRANTVTRRHGKSTSLLRREIMTYQEDGTLIMSPACQNALDDATDTSSPPESPCLMLEGNRSEHQRRSDGYGSPELRPSSDGSRGQSSSVEPTTDAPSSTAVVRSRANAVNRRHGKASSMLRQRCTTDVPCDDDEDHSEQPASGACDSDCSDSPEHQPELNGSSMAEPQAWGASTRSLPSSEAGSSPPTAVRERSNAVNRRHGKSSVMLRQRMQTDIPGDNQTDDEPSASPLCNGKACNESSCKHTAGNDIDIHSCTSWGDPEQNAPISTSATRCRANAVTRRHGKSSVLLRQKIHTDDHTGANDDDQDDDDNDAPNVPPPVFHAPGYMESDSDHSPEEKCEDLHPVNGDHASPAVAPVRSRANAVNRRHGKASVMLRNRIQTDAAGADEDIEEIDVSTPIHPAEGCFDDESVADMPCPVAVVRGRANAVNRRHGKATTQLRQRIQTDMPDDDDDDQSADQTASCEPCSTNSQSDGHCSPISEAPSVDGCDDVPVSSAAVVRSRANAVTRRHGKSCNLLRQRIITDPTLGEDQEAPVFTECDTGPVAKTTADVVADYPNGGDDTCAGPPAAVVRSRANAVTRRHGKSSNLLRERVHTEPVADDDEPACPIDCESESDGAEQPQLHLEAATASITAIPSTPLSPITRGRANTITRRHGKASNLLRSRMQLEPDEDSDSKEDNSGARSSIGDCEPSTTPTGFFSIGEEPSTPPAAFTSSQEPNNSSSSLLTSSSNQSVGAPLETDAFSTPAVSPRTRGRADTITRRHGKASNLLRSKVSTDPSIVVPDDETLGMDAGSESPSSTVSHEMLNVVEDASQIVDGTSAPTPRQRANTITRRHGKASNLLRSKITTDGGEDQADPCDSPIDATSPRGLSLMPRTHSAESSESTASAPRIVSNRSSTLLVARPNTLSSSEGGNSPSPNVHSGILASRGLGSLRVPKLIMPSAEYIHRTSTDGSVMTGCSDTSSSDQPFSNFNSPQVAHRTVSTGSASPSPTPASLLATPLFSLLQAASPKSSVTPPGVSPSSASSLPTPLLASSDPPSPAVLSKGLGVLRTSKVAHPMSGSVDSFSRSGDSLNSALSPRPTEQTLTVPASLPDQPPLVNTSATSSCPSSPTGSVVADSPVAKASPSVSLVGLKRGTIIPLNRSSFQLPSSSPNLLAPTTPSLLAPRTSLTPSPKACSTTSSSTQDASNSSSL